MAVPRRLWRDVVSATLVLFIATTSLDAAEPDAERMMVRAHAARAEWNNLPGFSADVVVSTDGKTAKGRLTVAADGDVKLALAESAQATWATRRLESLVRHRLPREGRNKFKVSFADKLTTHPLGRLIRFHDDRLHSVYRIKGDVITEVHRKMGGSQFTISVTAVSRNEAGKVLPQSYSVSWWDAKSGNLAACDVVRNEWVRIGRFDLPTKILSVRTEPKGKREVRQIIVRNHKLLKPSKNSSRR